MNLEDRGIVIHLALVYSHPPVRALFAGTLPPTVAFVDLGVSPDVVVRRISQKNQRRSHHCRTLLQLQTEGKFVKLYMDKTLSWHACHRRGSNFIYGVQRTYSWLIT